MCVCVLCLLAHMKCDINNALNWIIPSLRQHKCTKYTHSTKSECKDLNWHHLLDTIRGFWRKSKKVRTTNLLRAAIWRWCGYVSILILVCARCGSETILCPNLTGGCCCQGWWIYLPVTPPTVHPVVRDSTVKAVLSTPEQTKKALKPHFTNDIRSARYSVCPQQLKFTFWFKAQNRFGQCALFYPLKSNLIIHSKKNWAIWHGEYIWQPPPPSITFSQEGESLAFI